MQVLIVDDHMDTRAMCAAVIRNLGHHVEAVPTIAAALAAAQRTSFDLLICDIMLPDGIGYDLMANLAAGQSLRGIALTGCATREDVNRSRAAGFARHLSKPFDLRVLEAMVTEMAEAQTASA